MALWKDRINIGMVAYSSDNERVGKVIRCEDSGFLLEKGFMFPKDYLLRYDHIRDIKNDQLYLDLTKGALTQLWEHGGERGTATSTAVPAAGSRLDTSSEVRVPVTEEELEVRKGIKEKGEVRIHKDVVTETKQVSVPVTREEIRVERVPIDTPREARSGEASFQGGDIRIPIREEEVEISKRPVVKEEVRVSKEARTEEKKVSEQLRKEKVEVERGRAEEEVEPALRRTEIRESELRAGGRDTLGRTEEEALRERSSMMPGKSDYTKKI